MLYEKFDLFSVEMVAGFLVVFLGGAIAAYDPAKGLIARVRTGGAGA
jgi:ABC-2 type transport system permease protein